MDKVLYITNIFPNYRRELWDRLNDSKLYSFQFYFSFEDFNGIKGGHKLNYSNNSISFHEIKNLLFLGRIIWQTNVLKSLVFKNYNSVIFMGDMNIISTWLGIAICKLRRKKVLLWSHGVYGNEKYLKKGIRLFFLNLADTNLLYENRAKSLLIEKGFKQKKLRVIYNSINYNEQYVNYKNLQSLFDLEFKVKKPFRLLFIGRLTKGKKINLLIKAIYILNSEKVEFSLTIVGSGLEKQNLLELCVLLGIEQYVKFEEETYAENKIGEFLINSDLMVSPGNVGLNALHSLSYGTPVCTHNNFSNQMPEVEIIKENIIGFFFKENDHKDLALKIKYWFKNFHNQLTRDEIRGHINYNYNPLHQSRTIENALKDG